MANLCSKIGVNSTAYIKAHPTHAYFAGAGVAALLTGAFFGTALGLAVGSGLAAVYEIGSRHYPKEKKQLVNQDRIAEKNKDQERFDRLDKDRGVVAPQISNTPTPLVSKLSKDLLIYETYAIDCTSDKKFESLGVVLQALATPHFKEAIPAAIKIRLRENLLFPKGVVELHKRLLFAELASEKRDALYEIGKIFRSIEIYEDDLVILRTALAKLGEEGYPQGFENHNDVNLDEINTLLVLLEWHNCYYAKTNEIPIAKIKSLYAALQQKQKAPVGSLENKRELDAGKMIKCLTECTEDDTFNINNHKVQYVIQPQTTKASYGKAPAVVIIQAKETKAIGLPQLTQKFTIKGKETEYTAIGIIFSDGTASIRKMVEKPRILGLGTRRVVQWFDCRPNAHETISEQAAKSVEGRFYPDFVIMEPTKKTV